MCSIECEDKLDHFVSLAVMTFNCYRSLYVMSRINMMDLAYTL